MSHPRHVAIIMDGNGRWAQLRGRDRAFGHIKGARVAKNVIEEASHQGVSFLTLYAFSTENWLRPANEVSFLMRLLARNLKRERANLMKNNIRFNCIGEFSKIPKAVLNEISLSIQETKANTGMTLTFALSYGARQEITLAVKEIAGRIASGEISPEQVDESLIASHLQTADLPDPDLLIRTSGEYRLSNFLSWQTVYSEIYFTSTLWPDFDKKSLQEACSFFQTRQRRFGKTQEQLPQATENLDTP